VSDIIGVVDVGAAPVRHRRPAVFQVRAFYLAISVVLTLYVLIGFWASYYGRILSGTVAGPWFFQLHGAIFTGWLLLLLAQVGLVAARRVALHRRVGNVGIAYGVLLFVVGVAMTFVSPVMHVRAGEWTVDQAAGFMLLPLGDMVLFPAFFGAAVAYRRQPEIHKRLIVLATIALAFAGVFRMALPPLLGFVVWLLPLAAAMLFDAATYGRIHRVYLISAPVLALAFTRIFFMDSAAWLPVGRGLLALFL